MNAGFWHDRWEKEQLGFHEGRPNTLLAHLLITFDYDQTLMEGPPFSVADDEVGELYAETHEVTLVERSAVPDKLKGICPADECAWLLRTR